MPLSPATDSPSWVVFSDVDGTLVHYLDQPNTNSSVVVLPPTRTGAVGVISSRTVQLCRQLRSRVPLVLVSGMRSTTFFQRLPFLPQADAYAIESGGRIFYPQQQEPPSCSSSSSLLDNCFNLVEDFEWARQLDTTVSDLPVEQRTGKLWEYAHQLVQQGYILDTHGYHTAFRINRKRQSEQQQCLFEEFLKKCRQRERSGIPPELGFSTNLGCIDIFPIKSGKKNCCAYLVRKLIGNSRTETEDDDDDDDESLLLKRHAMCLCDDDNDIEMALACRKAFLPSVSSDTLRQIVDRQSGLGEERTLIVTENLERGIVNMKATELALEMVLEELRHSLE